MVADGFTALKFDVDDLRHPAKFDAANHTANAAEIRSMVERVAAVRDAIGPDIDLCIDLHARYDVPSACRIAWEMEPFKLLWLEEPIPAENVDALRQVRARSRTPICVGENLYMRWGFRELLEQQAADVIMPDVPKCGGLAESKKIANLAEVYYLPFRAAPRLDAARHDGDLPHLRRRSQFPRARMARARGARGLGQLCRRPRRVRLDRQGRTYRHARTLPGIGVELNMESVKRHAVPGYGVFA